MLIHIFKGGTRLSSNGIERTYTESELDEMVNSYDPSVHEAPLVFDHIGDDRRHPGQKLTRPAAGWCKGLVRKGLDLYAEVDWSDLGKKALEGKLFKKRSAAFYTPDSVVNPTPGKWSLRHIAMLGAEPPAVKGLEPIIYSEDEEGVLSYEEEFKVKDKEFGPSTVDSESPIKLLKDKYKEYELDMAIKKEEQLKTATDKLMTDTAATTGEPAPVETGGEPAETVEPEIESALATNEDSEEEVEQPETTDSPETLTQEAQANEDEQYKEKTKEIAKVKEEIEEEGVKSESEPESDDDDEEEEDDEEDEEFEESGSDNAEKLELASLRARVTEYEEKARALEEQNQALQRKARSKELNSQVSALYREGKLTSATIRQDELVEFMEGLEFGTIEFSEGQTVATALLKILSKLPSSVDFGNYGDTPEFMEDEELSPHEQALKLVAKNPDLDYVEAIKQVLYPKQ